MKTLLLGGVLAAVLAVPASAVTFDFNSNNTGLCACGTPGGVVNVAGSITLDASAPPVTIADDGKTYTYSPVTVSIDLLDFQGSTLHSEHDTSQLIVTTTGNFSLPTAEISVQTQSLDLDLVFGGTFSGTGLDIMEAIAAGDLSTSSLSFFVLKGTGLPSPFNKDFSALSIPQPDGVTWRDVTPTPLPPALPIFGAGLGLLALLAMRRRSRSLEPVAA